MTLLTREQVREFDRRAIEDLGIPSIVLMENAGRGAAEALGAGFADQRPATAVVCGGGHNGGDGFVIARHLVNRGWPVTLLTCTSAQALPPDARVNHDIAQRMRIPMQPVLNDDGRLETQRVRHVLETADLLVDALLGTGFCGAVRPPLDAVIEMINAAPGKRIAVDVPSGLDCDTGQAAGPAVRADLTVTFVAPKVGFIRPGARTFTGAVVVVDIGIGLHSLSLPA